MTSGARGKDCKWDSSSDRALEAIKTRKNDEDEAILRETISKVTDINAWHTYKNAEFNLLFHAVIEDNRSGFDILLEAGADPAMKNHSGNSAMNLVLIKRKLVDWAAAAVEAVRKVHGDEGARKFVDRIKTSSGWTPLMSAAENDNPLAVRWLLDHGANPNTAMSTGWTAMHAAAKNGNADLLLMLLEAGGDQNLEAVHRDFGRNLTLKDVTDDKAVLEVVDNFSKKKKKTQHDQRKAINA